MAGTKKSLQIAFVILLIMMILAFVYALMATITPQIIVMRSFQGYVGTAWAEFVGSNPSVAGYIITLERMAGGLGLALTLGSFLVLFTAFKKAEKWAWFYVLIIGVIAWVNNLVANLAVGNPMTTWICVIGLILLALGLIIPSKKFFCKG